jgi:hypothetical protein
VLPSGKVVRLQIEIHALPECINMRYNFANLLYNKNKETKLKGKKDERNTERQQVSNK